MDEQKTILVKKIIKYSIFGIIAIIIGWGSWVIVPNGEAGVVLRMQSYDRTIPSGFHFKLPIVESVKKLSTRIQVFETSASSFSKDIQTADTKIALNYHLSQEVLGTFWSKIGQDYTVTVIAPAVQESVKVATAKFTAQELVEKRPLVKDEIKKELISRLQAKYITVDDFSIINFDFSEVYEKAVESKQVAQQDALTSKNKLEQVKYEAEQAIVQAEGKAKALEIEGRAITENPQVLQGRAIEKWNGVLPTVTGSNIPFINIK
jgi:regulator of protease activity HflC (stomatin/prohibitin superfamily)